ncbi:unnamed protein product [Blepharisma stoltei]|uniref:Uncharacterized protein n=1 Tax=Blepharisma stoltei TaxID=1481888 RepID=A0AAU9IHC2_9CILI|nr:unnamed protein product [Blepharisma stoltei]
MNFSYDLKSQLEKNPCLGSWYGLQRGFTSESLPHYNSFSMEKFTNQKKKQRLREAKLAKEKIHLSVRQEKRRLEELEFRASMELKKTLVNELNKKCIEENNKQLAAVKIQKIARGWLVRNKFDDMIIQHRKRLTDFNISTMDTEITYQFYHSKQCNGAAIVIQEHYKRYLFKCKLQRLKRGYLHFCSDKKSQAERLIKRTIKIFISKIRVIEARVIYERNKKLREIRERLAILTIKDYWTKNNLQAKSIKRRFRHHKRRKTIEKRDKDFLEDPATSHHGSAELIFPQDFQNLLSEVREIDLSSILGTKEIELSKISYNVKSPKPKELTPIIHRDKKRLYYPTYSSYSRSRTISRVSTRPDSRAFDLWTQPSSDKWTYRASRDRFSSNSYYIPRNSTSETPEEKGKFKLNENSFRQISTSSDRKKRNRFHSRSYHITRAETPDENYGAKEEIDPYKKAFINPYKVKNSGPYHHAARKSESEIEKKKFELKEEICQMKVPPVNSERPKRSRFNSNSYQIVKKPTNENTEAKIIEVKEEKDPFRASFMNSKIDFTYHIGKFERPKTSQVNRFFSEIFKYK